MDASETNKSGADWRRRVEWGTAVLCWGYAVACLAGWLFIRFAAERWWPATFMLFAPRWLWAVPLALVLPATIIFRRRLVWVPGITGLVILFALLGFSIPWRTWRPHSAGHVSLRVLSCNAHARQMTNDTIDELLSQYKPDIVAFQDYWPRQTPESLRQPGWFTHRNDELFVASRYPIGKVEDLGIHAVRPQDQTALGLSKRGMAAAYSIELPAGPITFVNLHLASAHQGLSAMREDAELSGSLLARNSDRRREESETIRKRVNEIGSPVIITGDFNTPDDSPIFRSNWAGLQDAFTTAGWGFGITYAKHRTALRIDHVLCDPGWTIRSCRVGADVGSGHHVLVTDLQR